MTKKEKLLQIREAYEMLITCIANNEIPDYGLALTEAPQYIKELIEEEEKPLKQSIERVIKILDRPMLKDDFVPNINHAIKVMKDALEE